MNMKTIDTSAGLPPLKKEKKELIDKNQLLKISEEVKKILKKEGRIEKETNENFSSPRNALGC